MGRRRASAARARTLLQRLHGGGGLQRDQALPLQVENVLLLELLHLDELLLEGQLLAAELLAEGRRTETRTDRQTEEGKNGGQHFHVICNHFMQSSGIKQCI